MITYVLCGLLLIKVIIAASPPGDVVDKLSVGYQGWFACASDNSPHNTWMHWAPFNVKPSPGQYSFELWPDVREFTKTYQTGFANLGNGQPAKLYSAYDDQTVQVHFNWMSANGIDTVALQRFGTGMFQHPNSLAWVNGMANKVKTNAERTNRKFYISWDISQWDNFLDEIKRDWKENVMNLTKSRAYAKQNGKPVICVWGIGVPDRPGNQDQFLDLIRFLKTSGLYVIGGTPQHWRTGVGVKPDFLRVFQQLDMIFPWRVGTFNTLDQAKNDQPFLSAELDYLKKTNIDYQPVIFPGSAASNRHTEPPNHCPRLHGDFMWAQFVNLRTLGIKTTYVAMFDEFDEGTAIAKAAEGKSMIPTNQYFLTLDADGVHVSSDFYLRLTKDGNEMVKGMSPLRQKHTTPFT